MWCYVGARGSAAGARCCGQPGEAIFRPAVAQRLMRYCAALPHTAAAIAFPELTERERQILHLIAQGESNAAIAKQLVLSTKTVQKPVSNIFSKLQVVDRSPAIVRAREAGLGRRPRADGKAGPS